MDTVPETYFRYFPASPLDEDWGIFVTTAGYVNIAPGAKYPPPGHPKGYAFDWQHGRKLHEFQLHYITRGGGIFESRTGGRKRCPLSTRPSGGQRAGIRSRRFST